MRRNRDGNIIVLKFDEEVDTKSIFASLLALRNLEIEPLSSKKELRFDILLIDERFRIVRLNERIVKLTPMEFDILYLLARHPGQVFSARKIYEAVASDIHEGSWDGMSSMIYKLRCKLGVGYIETIYGCGYKFSVKN